MFEYKEFCRCMRNLIHRVKVVFRFIDKVGNRKSLFGHRKGVSYDILVFGYCL